MIALHRIRHSLPRPCFGRWLVLAILLFGVLSVGITLSPMRSGFADAPDRPQGDLDLYDAVVQRVRVGENFWQAMGVEMRTRNYPRSSLFNWRPPVPQAVLGQFPDLTLPKAVLGAAALAVLLLGFDWLAREGRMTDAVVGGLCLTGAVMPTILGRCLLMTELWSGTLMALSLCFYARRQRLWGAGAGMAALFCRELTAPYVVLSVFWALRRRRWSELFVWGGGLAAYAIYYCYHIQQVAAARLPSEWVPHHPGWLCVGGLPFVISTAQMNAYCLVLPQWFSALLLTAALLGIAGWQTPTGQRLAWTVLAYLVAFAVIGQPFNQYWGSQFGPLLALAVGRAPRSFQALWWSQRETQRESAVSATAPLHI